MYFVVVNFSYVHVYIGSIFGESHVLSPESKEFIKFSHLNELFVQQLFSFGVATLMAPRIQWLQNKLFRMVGYTTTVEQQCEMIESWMNRYDNSISINNNNTNKDDSVKTDLYYPRLKMAFESGNVTRRQVIADIHATFVAGIDTTATAIEQGILYLAKCGIKTQNILYDEINKICNNDIGNILKNRNKFIYLTSFINELFRFHGSVRTSLARHISKKHVTIKFNSQDVGLPGENREIEYNIPKNTTIYVNLWTMNHSNDHWKGNGLNAHDLDIFKPMRFVESLQSDNKDDKNKIYIFGAGKRSCPGRELALKQIYLAFATLIQRYEFDVPDEYLNKRNQFDVPFRMENSPVIGVNVRRRENV